VGSRRGRRKAVAAVKAWRRRPQPLSRRDVRHPHPPPEPAMTVQIGDPIPSAPLTRATDAGAKPVSTDEIFGGKTVALFAVPGAFPPTCSAKHLPGFKERREELAGKGVDTIACVSVNDAFVMGAWADSQGIGKNDILMLGDGNG